MAEIAPLKGVVYNQEKVGGLEKLVAPPYDVVTPEEQAAFHRSHQHNVMHIDLGAQRLEDNHPYDWHARAADLYKNWLTEGVFIRHDGPAVYYTEMDFSDPTTGVKKTRHGFICLLRLEEFGASSRVRPHERTFSAHKAERLRHLEHLGAHLSQIFTVFPDEKQQAQSILEAGLKGEPLFDFTDQEGQQHRLWPIWKPGVIRALGDFMLDKTVYIADGHHRYETSLNYRRLKAEQGLEIGPRSPLNYTLVYLCPISDPGLCILPAHRVLSKSLTMKKEELEMRLNKYFEIKTFSFTMVEERAARQAFMRRLQVEGSTKNVVGLYTKLARTYYLLKKRPAAVNGTALALWPDPLQKLDTVVLYGLVFQEALGLSDEDLDDPSRIAYISRVSQAIGRVNDGRADVACILNPTRMEYVQDVAEAGLIMPRKSTYFYPKVTTGLVFNAIDPSEEIEPASKGSGF